MNKSEAVIKRLRFENYIWIVYLVIALGNIWADELIVKSIEEHEEKYDKLAKIIFLISLIVTLIIYIYFLNRNYNDYVNSNMKNKKTYEIRFLGSIFVFVGTFCFLYFIIKMPSVEESVSNI